jgi:hypothetical protein
LLGAETSVGNAATVVDRQGVGDEEGITSDFFELVVRQFTHISG